MGELVKSYGIDDDGINRQVDGFLEASAGRAFLEPFHCATSDALLASASSAALLATHTHRYVLRVPDMYASTSHPIPTS